MIEAHHLDYKAASDLCSMTFEDADAGDLLIDVSDVAWADVALTVDS